MNASIAVADGDAKARNQSPVDPETGPAQLRRRLDAEIVQRQPEGIGKHPSIGVDCVLHFILAESVFIHQEGEGAQRQNAGVIGFAPVALHIAREAVHLDYAKFIVASISYFIICHPGAINMDAGSQGIGARLDPFVRKRVDNSVGDGISQSAYAIYPGIEYSNAIIREILVLPEVGA